MASYEALRSYFDNSERLLDVVRKAAAFPIVTGFTLNLDPLWRALYDRHNFLSDGTRSYWWDEETQRHLDDWNPADPPRYEPNDTGFRRRDLHASLPEWDGLANQYRSRTHLDRLPVIMTVVHRPLRAARPGQKDEEDDTAMLQGLHRAVRDMGVAVRIEERVGAELALACGDSILTSNGGSGTLGGVLHDKAKGVSYGVTCAHVAQVNDQINDGAHHPVGVCRYSTTQVALPSAKVCDPVNLSTPQPTPGNGPDLNMLDCAMVELSSSVTGPAIAGVAPSLSPGQSVVLTGAVTRTTRHWLGSLCLSYSFTTGGKNYCFRDAIELSPQPRGVLGRRTAPKRGDSGGWILTNGQAPEWAGMLFGADGRRGFAIRAAWIHRWARSATGTALTT